MSIFTEAVGSAVQQASEIAGVLDWGVPLETDSMNNTNQAVPAAQSSLGNQDITVVTHPAVTINTLLHKMHTMQAGLAVALEPLFRNTTAQILICAAGKGGFMQESTECDYFTTLGAGHNGVVKAAKAMGVQPTCFVTQADAVITRRNGYIHPLPLAALEEQVGRLQEQISPALQHICNWECKVVSHYQAIKESFPGCFE